MRLIITVRMLLIAVLIKNDLFFLCFPPGGSMDDIITKMEVE